MAKTLDGSGILVFLLCVMFVFPAVLIIVERRRGGKRKLRVHALGKQGAITGLLKTLGGMSPEERQEQGPRIHGLREAVTAEAERAVKDLASHGWELVGPTEDLLPGVDAFAARPDEVTPATADVVRAQPDVKSAFEAVRAGNATIYVSLKDKEEGRERTSTEFTREVQPLLAILPGVALQELWSLMGTAEKALFVISLFVVLTGLIGMLTAILTSLNERRREMAILRSVGARPWHIASLLVLEAFALALAGVVAGLALGEQPGVRGRARRGLEAPREGAGGHRTLTRQRLHGPVVVRRAETARGGDEIGRAPRRLCGRVAGRGWAARRRFC